MHTREVQAAEVDASQVFFFDALAPEADFAVGVKAPEGVEPLSSMLLDHLGEVGDVLAVPCLRRVW